MKETKMIDLKEFRDLGYLQEVNRQFFHPLGLALELVQEEDGRISSIGGVWDYRDDPEGIVFRDLTGETRAAKANIVDNQRKRIAKTRKKRFGWTIQPIGHICEE